MVTMSDWLASGSLVVAVSAFGLSVYAVITSTRLQRRQVRQMDEEEAARRKADVRVELTRDFTNSRFNITNQGQGTAHDVRFSLDVDEGRASPLVPSDCSRKLPIPTLRPGEEVRLLAAVNKDTGTVFDGRWSWRNEDGTTEEISGRVSL